MKHILLSLLLLIIAPSFAQQKNESTGFIENKGQITDQNGKPNLAVQFLLNTNGLNVQIKKNGFSYDIYEVKKKLVKHRIEDKNTFSSLAKNDKKIANYTLEYVFHRIDIDFVNSNSNVKLIPSEESKDYDNYYNIPNKPEGILGVHKFKQITYKNIYPNIDVVFSIPKDTLKPVEYNFVVHPNGKIADIQLKFNGAKSELADNKIKINVRFGQMEEILPSSWTEDGIEKKKITVGYKKIKNNVYGFETANAIYDKTVIIDPVPVRLWGTYYGGENLEFSSSVFVKNSFVYWAGITYSIGNIASSGAHQNYYTAGWDYDCFFTKLNSDGTRVWGTYYGGGYADRINQIKVSNNDNVYIAGETLSKNNIATLDSHQQNSGNPVWNSYDGFLVKFDSNGIRQWGTYYGDLNDERINSLTIDSNEKIYISGETSSDKSMATIGSYQPNYTSQGPYPYDGFIGKFNSNGVREWATYFGGNNRDAILDSKLDSKGDLIFLGITNSTSGISTPNASQEINNGTDGFVVKFDPNGNRIWGTYFGGNNDDLFFNLGIDASDNLYCFGQTYSTLNISTSGVFQEIFKINQFNYSGCIFKLDPNGFKTWGSYFFPETLGGSVSKTGNVYFTGRVENGFIPTPNAYQEIRNTGTESYLVKYNTDGQREWSTYFGGEMADNAYLTEVDNNSNIYLAGSTNSFTNIATPNTYQPNRYPDTNFYTFNGGDAFLVKFKDCLSSTTATSNSPICVSETLELNASGGTNYAWTGPNSFTSTLQNPIILNATNLNSGKYSCLITGTSGCDDTKSVDIIVGDIQAPVPDLATLPTINGDCNTRVLTIPTATDACAGAITATTTSTLSYNLPGTYIIVWKLDDGNGNSVNQNQTVIISSQPTPSLPSPQNFCIQQNATLNNITIAGQNIKWYDILTNGNLLLNTTSLQNGTTYYASQTINGCESERIPVVVNIQNTPAPTGNASQSFCSTQNATLNDIAINGTSIKLYMAATNGTPLASSTLLQDGITYYATQTINDCESLSRLGVTISLINTLNATNYSETICDDQNNGNEIVNLKSYNSNLIGSTGNTFGYYTSANAAGNQITTSQITNFSNYNLTLGKHSVYVRIDSPNSCHQIVELQITLVSKPIINIPNIVPICENNTITIDAGSGSDTYLWSNGASTSSITVSNPGDFSVIVSKNYGTTSCSSTKNFTVKKSNIATITSIETKDWTDNENSITAYVTGAGDYEYSIDGIYFQNSNQFLNVHKGEYTVEVRDKNGCGTATDEVYLLMFPKFFTPNGDGYNDTWSIHFSDLEIGLTVKIFDRYGKFIKELIQNATWNGTFNGRELPATDYWFVVTRANGKEYRGHFSLKR